MDERKQAFDEVLILLTNLKYAVSMEKERSFLSRFSGHTRGCEFTLNFLLDRVNEMRDSEKLPEGVIKRVMENFKSIQNEAKND
jgi:hypothetical protein